VPSAKPAPFSRTTPQQVTRDIGTDTATPLSPVGGGGAKPLTALRLSQSAYCLSRFAAMALFDCSLHMDSPFEFLIEDDTNLTVSAGKKCTCEVRHPAKRPARRN